MDPQANLSEQLDLARKVIAELERITDDGGNTPDEFYEDGTVDNILQSGERLAELVLALDEWRCKGGFDPYSRDRFVYAIVRGWQDFDGPEADIFSTREAAEEQLERLGGEDENTSSVQEQLIYDQPFAHKEEDE